MTRRQLIIGGVIAAIVLGVLTISILGSVISNFGNIIDWANSASDPTKIVFCSDSAACSIAHPIVFGLVLFFILLTGFAYTTLLERKLLAYFQHRTGPNRVGPGGFLQPAADGVKLIFKEDIIPDNVDKPVYYIAPLLKAVPILVAVAVIPIGPDILVPWFDGMWYQVSLGLADVNVGVLYVVGILSISTYGMVLAGWASRNKYSMLGGLRASAQMISYELSMGLAMAVPVLIVGSMSFGDIVEAQGNIWEWFIFQNPLAAGILVIALFAETARAPFDIPEAEQELTAGYMTEYSGMKFALFMMAEYLGMITVSMIFVSLFLGGYNLIPIEGIPILGPVIMIGKVVACLVFFIWVRATLPRLRYDRLMSLGWKVLLPLSLVAVAWSSIAVVLGDASGSPVVYGVVSGIFFLVVVGGGYAFLRAETGEQEEEELDYADDPYITGERRGPAWIGLNILGGLISIPFAMVNGLVNSLDRLGKTLEGNPEERTITSSNEQGGD